MTDIFFSKKSAKKRILINENFIFGVFLMYIIIVYEIFTVDFDIMIFCADLMFISSLAGFIRIRYYINIISYDEKGIYIKYSKWFIAHEVFINWLDLKVNTKMMSYVIKGKTLFLIVKNGNSQIIKQGSKFGLEYTDWTSDTVERVVEKLNKLKDEHLQARKAHE